MDLALALDALGVTVLATLLGVVFLRTPKPIKPTSDNPKDIFAADVQRRPLTIPLSARWLAAASSHAQLPYHLRGDVHASGLKPLEDPHWIEIDPNRERFRRELLLKQKLLQKGGPYYDIVSASSGSDTLVAQTKVLRMLFVALLARSQERQEHRFFDATGEEVKVHRNEGLEAAAESVAVVEVAGERHLVAEWQDRPIGLACLLVQEDFILLHKNPQGEFVFVAGAACFSFSEVGLHGQRGHMELGKPIQFIHSQVPGFEEHMITMVTRVFDRLSAPFYRTNWNLAPSGNLSPFEAEILRGTSDSSPPLSTHAFSRIGADQGVVYSTEGKAPKELWLKVEHQTIHKIEADGVYILFTIHTYADILEKLKEDSLASTLLLPSRLSS